MESTNYGKSFCLGTLHVRTGHTAELGQDWSRSDFMTDNNKSPGAGYRSVQEVISGIGYRHASGIRLVCWMQPYCRYTLFVANYGDLLVIRYGQLRVFAAYTYMQSS